MNAVDTALNMNASDEQHKKTRVAIVGGGPGGLFTAWHLETKAADTCDITIFEASERPGGKIVTRNFSGVGIYEAGVAEIYDYSRLGPDPLRELIEKDLGLKIKHIEGGPCIINNKIILSVDDLAAHFGERTRDEAKAFRDRCAEMLSPEEFYLSVAEADNAHPWASVSGDALLSREIRDDDARRYIRAMAHSDVAAAPHQTNGLTFLKNVLMDVDGYMDIYSVLGGNERIVNGLVDELSSQIRLNSPVKSVQPLPDGTYRLHVDANGFQEFFIADYVVLALPLTALSMIHWRSEELQEAVDRHVRHFDRPGHYLRATLLFERPFWREHIPKDWWMLDAFDGCCVYDEGARHDLGGKGALAFLIAGNAALGLANASDERIEQLCLDALPRELGDAHGLFLERRIHRWMASVNAIPGGLETRHRVVNHRPNPRGLPGIIMVGDYMFDATLNGVLDSADAATDIILSDVLQHRHAERKKGSGLLGGQRFSKTAPAETMLERFFAPDSLADMLRIAWRLEKGARILHLGSASGKTVGALRALGFDAVGVEPSRLAHVLTQHHQLEYNFCGELVDQQFADDAFDVVLETCLHRLPRDRVIPSIQEISRICRHGVVLGSVTTDLPIDLIERHDLMEGVQTLGSRWDWSERLYGAGFTHALMDERLDAIWKRAVAAGAGPGHWYEDAESVLYCFYQRGTPRAGASALATADSAREKSAINLRGVA